MKILVVSSGVHPVPPVEGGAVENLINFLIEDSNNEFIVYSNYSKEAKIKSEESVYKNIKFRFINVNKKNVIVMLKNLEEKVFRRFFKRYIGDYYIKQAIKKIKKEKFDYILVENNPLYGYLINKKIKNVKIILHSHNDYLNKESFLAQKVIKAYDKIICVSKFIATRVNEINPENRNIHVLYNGIKFDNYIYNKEEIKKRYGLSPNKKTIIYSGRVVPEKGVLELIQAFKEFNNQDYQLLIAGGHNYGARTKSEFEKKIMNIAKNEEIIFTGYIAYERMNEVYSIGDVGCIPSIINEACPLTAIEMMNNELPIICTNSGGLPELVNTKCGIIVSRENLKDNILRALNKYSKINDKEIEIMKKNARSNSKNFSIDNYIKNFWLLMESFYKEDNQ